MKVYRYVLLSIRDPKFDTRLDFLITSSFSDIKVEKRQTKSLIFLCEKSKVRDIKGPETFLKVRTVCY
jgi:hypothetical protein